MASGTGPTYGRTPLWSRHTQDSAEPFASAQMVLSAAAYTSLVFWAMTSRLLKVMPHEAGLHTAHHGLHKMMVL
jgi:hypothetical protein